MCITIILAGIQLRLANLFIDQTNVFPHAVNIDYFIKSIVGVTSEVLKLLLVLIYNFQFCQLFYDSKRPCLCNTHGAFHTWLCDIFKQQLMCKFFRVLQPSFTFTIIQITTTQIISHDLWFLSDYHTTISSTLPIVCDNADVAKIKLQHQGSARNENKRRLNELGTIIERLVHVWFNKVSCRYSRDP